MAKKTSHYRYDTNRHQGSLFGDDADYVFNTPSQPEQAAKPADPAPKAVDADAIDSRLEVKVVPEFRFICFGSGSSGNCAYVGTPTEGVLIDAGVDMKKVFDTLKVNGIEPGMVKGVCLTHDHGDHVRYAYTYVRKYRHLKIYCTPRVLNGMLRRHNISRRIRESHVPIFKEIDFSLAGMKITAFEVPHDGTCNSGFFIENGELKFTIATDLGHINDRAEFYLSKANFMMLESNYDHAMLLNGSYPEYLKSRILNETGHLDNHDAATFVRDHYSPQLKYVFLCHLSNDNNTPEKAINEFAQVLGPAGITIGLGQDTIEDRKCNLQVVALPRFDATHRYILR